MDSNSVFRCIGKGFCGTVWAKTNDPQYALKREDGGPGRSLRNDWEMHNHIYKSLESLPETVRLHFNAPAPQAIITASQSEWWTQRAALFPQGFEHCNTLISTRIPPFPRAIREKIIDKYCSPELAATIKSNPSDQDCLVRLYLGRRRHGQRSSRFRAFSLRNYPLHIDQMEELGLDLPLYSDALADALAMLHWVAKVDANDAEFVLAPPVPPSSSQVDSLVTSTQALFHNDMLGRHILWILDFDCCHPTNMQGQGLEKAVSAFLRNDPFFPRPHAVDERDQRLWQMFRSRYLVTSSRYVSEDQTSQPLAFMERLEEKAKELARAKGSLTAD